MAQANDWQEVIPSPGVTQPAAQPMQTDWQEVPVDKADPITGEKLPLAFSGITPETAMNKSPLSATERMKLSFGNEAGNVNYLKSRFKDVKPIMDAEGNPTSELAVLDKGSWYRVDPKNGDIADPWEKTKEYVKDAAELAPMVMGAAAGIASDLATGGASVPATAAIAGATQAALRTSLGRLIGTYDASPAEQAWDIGFESLLNAGAAKVLAGVKPTASWVANRLKPLAEAFKDTVEPAEGGAWANTSNPAKVLFKKIMTTLSVGEREFNTMADQPDTVANTMKQLAAKNGKDVVGYHDDAIEQQVNQIAGIAKDARKTLSSIYGKMRNDLLSKVPDSFVANIEDPVYAAYADALEKGIGTLRVGNKELMGKEALDYIAKNGMKNTGFRMYTQEEMGKYIGQGADLTSGLGFLAANKEAHSALKSFYDNLNQFTGGANRSGVDGARALLDFKKVASDLANTAMNSEQVKGMSEVAHIVARAKTAMDNSVFQELKKIGLDHDFRGLNSTYDTLSTQFAPLLAAQKKAAMSDLGNKAYEPLLNSFLARPSPSATARGAIDYAIQAAKDNGLDMLGAGLEVQKNRIQVLEAAKAFNPLKSSQLKSNAIQNLSQLLNQPVVAQKALATVQGLSKAQDMLANMTKSEVDRFLSSPEAMTAFTTGVIQAPIVRAQAEQTMNAILQQATQRPGQGPAQ